jgi:metallo-beta-lactamase class B
MKTTLLLTGLLLAGFFSDAQQPVEDGRRFVKRLTQDSWTRDYPPFRIAGNLYYVGTDELACYLITTPEGDILINTGVPGSAPMIRSHVEALGFAFRDIRILLTTQAHFDHVGAMAAVKNLTGAKFLVQEKDAPVLADGGSSDFDMGGKGPLFEPVTADGLLHEHDTIRLGGMQIVALHHPGHTKGACSYLFDVKDDNRVYRVLIANMPSILDETQPGMAAYPNVVEDYTYTFSAMKDLRFDIWVASHSSQFGLHEKHRPGDPYRPEAFADQQGYDSALSDLKTAFLQKIKQ